MGARRDDRRDLLEQTRSTEQKSGTSPLPMQLGSWSSHDRHPRRDFADWPARVRAAIQRMVEEEQRFGHDFLWIPVAMGLGATFALDRSVDMPLAADAVPLVCAICAVIATRMAAPRLTFAAVMTAAFLAGMTASAIEILRTGTVILDGEVVTHLEGTVIERQVDEKGHWRYTIDLSSTDDPVIRRPPTTVRLLARSSHEPIRLGGGIAGLARLSPPSGPVVPGGYDFAFGSYVRGIGAIGFFYGAPHATSPPEADSAGLTASFRQWIADVRESISSRIRRVLDGQAGALAAALTVADVGGLSDDTMADLRNSGLAHIISISGLHMALVAGTFFVVLRMLLALLPRVVHSVSIKKVAAIGALAVSTFYLIISGASVPTQRSWIMLAIMLVAVLIDRPAFTLRNVAIAAICIIAVSPSSVVGPSFQMSFAATAALVAAFGALSGWRARRNRGTMEHEAPWWKTAWLLVAATVFTSAVAGAATALFAAYHFHRLTSLGILGNLFATPVVSLVVMPMGLLSVLLMPYGLETWPLKAMGFGLDMVLAIAHHVASLGGIVSTGRIPTLAALVIGAGLLVLILMRSRLRLTGIAIIAAGCMMTFPPFAAAPPDILISEDGTLVSIVTSHGLATNRERPSTFVFDQWLSAMGATDKVSPRTEDVPVDAAAERAREAPARVAASPNLIDRMRSMLQTSADQRFTCFGKIWCGATFDDVSLITVSDAAYLGPACDLAKIVVTPEHVRMTQCRSGALLLTGRTLRRTGSVEVYIPDKGGRPDNDAASSQSDPQGLAVGASDGEISTEDLRVAAALDHVIRPWTIHRYYDWRTRSFDFSNGKPPVADLQSKQSFDTGQSNGSGL